jgi:hypothetical protein
MFINRQYKKNKEIIELIDDSSDDAVDDNILQKPHKLPFIRQSKHKKVSTEVKKT